MESAGDKERLQRQVDACVEARKSAASTLRKAETQLSLAKQTELLALQQKDEMKRSVGRRLWATLAKHVPERHTRARRPQTPVHRSAPCTPLTPLHPVRCCRHEALIERYRQREPPHELTAVSTRANHTRGHRSQPIQCTGRH